jgi:hypothetical protein
VIRQRALLVLGAVMVLGSGCAHQSKADESQLGDHPVGTAPITVDEITSAGLLGSTAFDVVQRLRPTFLIDRTAIRRSSQPIQVSINGGEITGTSVLNSTPASTVQEIRYLTYGQASARFGAKVNGPIILVMLR